MDAEHQLGIIGLLKTFLNASVCKLVKQAVCKTVTEKRCQFESDRAHLPIIKLATKRQKVALTYLLREGEGTVSERVLFERSDERSAKEKGRLP